MKSKFLAVLVAVSLVLLHRAEAQFVFQNVPGTPVSGFVNPGGPLINIGEGGGVGVQPIVNQSVNPPQPFSALAGDVVFLQDPAAGTAPSNWSAVVEFFNAADPNGLLNLAADYYQTFRPNNTPGGFANLALLPNTIYVSGPADPQDPVVVVYSEFGPSGQIPAGQYAIFTLVADAQPDLVPEPGTLGWLAAGVALAGMALRRSRARARRAAASLAGVRGSAADSD